MKSEILFKKESTEGVSVNQVTAIDYENESARSFGTILMDKCDEVWIFGNRLSSGMRTEYERALRKGYVHSYFRQGLFRKKNLQ